MSPAAPRISSRALPIRIALTLSPLAVTTLVWLAEVEPSTAQDHSTGDWASSDDSLQCEPSCRSGFECVQGECKPMCNPACGDGYLCTTSGVCVREKPKAPAQPRVEAQPFTNLEGCMPECRSGYVCIAAQCVSKCNPLCSEGEMCTDDGQCVPGMSEEPESAPVEKKEAAHDSIVNVHADLLGLLQFGLTPTVEVGKRLSGYARIRIPNTGMLSYLVVPRGDDMKFHWGLGGTLGMRFYASREATMRGGFGGVGLEYLFMRTRDESRRRAVYGTHALIPELEGGYRFHLGRLLLGLGGRIGLSIPAGKYDDPSGDPGCVGVGACDEDRDLLFVGGLFLELGAFL